LDRFWGFYRVSCSKKNAGGTENINVTHLFYHKNADFAMLIMKNPQQKSSRFFEKN